MGSLYVLCSRVTKPEDLLILIPKAAAELGVNWFITYDFSADSVAFIDKLFRQCRNNQSIFDLASIASMNLPTASDVLQNPPSLHNPTLPDDPRLKNARKPLSSRLTDNFVQRNFSSAPISIVASPPRQSQRERRSSWRLNDSVVQGRLQCFLIFNKLSINRI